jgi:hypothetical protein
MKWHFAITVVSIAALVALGVYGHFDVSWPLVAISTGHGAAQAMDNRPR